MVVSGSPTRTQSRGMPTVPYPPSCPMDEHVDLDEGMLFHHDDGAVVEVDSEQEVESDAEDQPEPYSDDSCELDMDADDRGIIIVGECVCMRPAQGFA